MLEGKKILIGISGSIAAYKMAALTRLFVKAGAEVKIIMTQAATEFVTPLTLATLSKNPVYKDFVKNNAGEWTNHVELGLWADILLIAPCSANTLAKMANGICDNLLLATYLSARCPVYFATAMDLDMLQHPTTQKNIATLLSHGNKLIDSTEGQLASGLEGKGRMAEPEEMFEIISNHFSNSLPLKDLKVLVTAGPTYEHLDPVRFIGNHSSGKMGYAIAEQLAQKGAQVILISGPTQLQVGSNRINKIPVTSAAEMYEACHQVFNQVDIAILSAAVADYTPSQTSSVKIKKVGDDLSLTLIKTKDILKSLGAIKSHQQTLVGFALETDNEVANALKKLKEKNLDAIVLNSLQDAGAGFGHDTNKIDMLFANGQHKKFQLKTKQEVAKDIVEEIINLVYEKTV
jgi:phosphopantothenoylcysteine decarboxylase / phosphopantothenate---cysteine ligase